MSYHPNCTCDTTGGRATCIVHGPLRIPVTHITTEEGAAEWWKQKAEAAERELEMVKRERVHRSDFDAALARAEAAERDQHLLRRTVKDQRQTLAAVRVVLPDIEETCEALERRDELVWARFLRSVLRELKRRTNEEGGRGLYGTDPPEPDPALDGEGEK